MDRILGRFEPQIYAILRIIVGLMFAVHGSQKLFGWPGGRLPMALDMLTKTGGVIEFVAGILIAIGLFGSIAAFIASGEMAVAYFKFHFINGFWPLLNKGEMAVLYCFVFLYIAARGSGVWSVDAAIARGRGRDLDRNGNRNRDRDLPPVH